MGWNDRLPTDPYLPPDDYYQSGAEEYNAWLEYVEMRLHEEGRGLTSQNLDPAALAGRLPVQETPVRQSFLSRIWAIIFGQEKPARKSIRETGERVSTETTDLPF